MKIVSGEIVVSGSLVYVPEQPWIINSSLRDNILLGSNFNQDRSEKFLLVYTELLCFVTGKSVVVLWIGCWES